MRTAIFKAFMSFFAALVACCPETVPCGADGLLIRFEGSDDGELKPGESEITVIADGAEFKSACDLSGAPQKDCLFSSLEETDTEVSFRSRAVWVGKHADGGIVGVQEVDIEVARDDRVTGEGTFRPAYTGKSEADRCGGPCEYGGSETITLDE